MKDPTEKIPARWRPEPKHPTWNRYRGRGARGKPRTVDTDRVDLDHAEAAIRAAEDLLVPLDVHEPVRAAMGQLDLAIRFVLEVRGRCQRTRDKNEPDRAVAGEIAALRAEVAALRARVGE